MVPTGPDRYRLAVTIDAEGYRLLGQVQALMSHRRSGQDLGSVITEAMELLRDRLETERFGSPRRRKMEEDVHTAPSKEELMATSTDATRDLAGSCATSPKEMADNNGEVGQSIQSAAQNTVAETEAGAKNPINHETHRPRTASDGSVKSGNPSRYIPKAIRRAVYDRDAGQCTFVDPRTGRRCSSQRVQIHHKKPWCLGGTHTTDNLTLLCKSHNDLAAEQDLGPIAVQGRSRALAKQQQADLPL